MEVYDATHERRIKILRAENDALREMLSYLRTKNMFEGPALRTGTDQVAPISDELARRIDALLRGE